MTFATAYLFAFMLIIFVSLCVVIYGLRKQLQETSVNLGLLNSVHRDVCERLREYRDENFDLRAKLDTCNTLIYTMAEEEANRLAALMPYPIPIIKTSEDKVTQATFFHLRFDTPTVCSVVTREEQMSCCFSDPDVSRMVYEGIANELAGVYSKEITRQLIDLDPLRRTG